MGYVRVADTTEVPVNTMTTVVAGGKEILLSNVDGSFYAIANKCTHLGGSLGKGVYEAGIVTCPRHGAKFDVRTGQSVGQAKIAIVKMNVRNEERYQVKVEGTDLLVEIP